MCYLLWLLFCWSQTTANFVYNVLTDGKLQFEQHWHRACSVPPSCSWMAVRRALLLAGSNRKKDHSFSTLKHECKFSYHHRVELQKLLSLSFLEKETEERKSLLIWKKGDKIIVGLLWGLNETVYSTVSQPCHYWHWELDNYCCGGCSMYCCCLVAQLCLTLCDPMDCSTPGLPVPHHLPKFAHVHVHCIGDAIQSSHPLTPSSPFVLNLPQHQGLFQWISCSHQRTKILELQLQHQSFAWVFRIDFP